MFGLAGQRKFYGSDGFVVLLRAAHATVPIFSFRNGLERMFCSFGRLRTLSGLEPFVSQLILTSVLFIFSR